MSEMLMVSGLIQNINFVSEAGSPYHYLHDGKGVPGNIFAPSGGS